MSWFLTIIILSFTFHNLAEAKHEKKSPSAVVVGTVYCDTCFMAEFSKSSHFISGASVAVECGDTSSKISFREEVKTNEHGEFKVHLPFSVSKHVKKIKRCSVKLISSSEPYCAVASTATSSSLHLKSKKQGTHIFSAGFFTFKPLKQPDLCNQKPSFKNSKQFNSMKPFVPTPIDPTFLPPIQDPPTPFLPPIDMPTLPPLPQLPPLPPLPGFPNLPIPPVPKNSKQFNSMKPFVPTPIDPTFPPPIQDPPTPFLPPIDVPILPPLPQLPPLPPGPPLPGFPNLPIPPVPKKAKLSKTTNSLKASQLLDQKEVHTDFFQPIPNIPLFPSPPAFGIPLPPNPFQPPSLLPPNPFQPPPSIFPPNPFQPQPPPSILPPNPFQPPSSPPGINLPPIPGFTPSSPPPPSPFRIPLPPFPFQPSPGFPGNPPP